MKIRAVVLICESVAKIAYLRLKYRKDRLSLPFGTIIDWRTRILVKKGKIKIGKNVSLRSRAQGYHAGLPFSATLFVDKENAVIDIGENSRINGAYIHAQGKTTIGAGSVIAAGVNILDSDGHLLQSSQRTLGRDVPGSITIGQNVWIGINTIVLKNTTIGDNSVVSAGSVVKGKFGPNSFIIGNPAKKEFTL